MLQPTLLRLAATAALLCATTLAHAQYAWIDANGTRQYSDRPPPPGTPAHRILKSPGRQAPSPLPATEPAAPAKPAESKHAATVAEQETAYRERIKQRAEQEKKDGEEAQRKRAQAAHCETARENHAALASGMRIARVGADGERSYLSDEEKAARMAQANRALQDCR